MTTENSFFGESIKSRFFVDVQKDQAPEMCLAAERSDENAQIRAQKIRISLPNLRLRLLFLPYPSCSEN